MVEDKQQIKMVWIWCFSRLQLSRYEQLASFFVGAALIYCASTSLSDRKIIFLWTELLPIVSDLRLAERKPPGHWAKPKCDKSKSKRGKSEQVIIRLWHIRQNINSKKIKTFSPFCCKIQKKAVLLHLNFRIEVLVYIRWRDSSVG